MTVLNAIVCVGPIQSCVMCSFKKNTFYSNTKKRNNNMFFFSPCLVSQWLRSNFSEPETVLVLRTKQWVRRCPLLRSRQGGRRHTAATRDARGTGGLSLTKRSKRCEAGGRRGLIFIFISICILDFLTLTFWIIYFVISLTVKCYTMVSLNKFTYN